MAAVPNTLISPEEYLAQERKAESKSEYLNGQVFALAGVRRAHSLINTNLTSMFAFELRDKGCEVHASDMRVRVNPSGDYLYAYPDISVTCQKPEFEDNQFDTLLNPLVLVEILSDSTEKRDRVTKAPLYRKLKSLREYLLISQSQPHVERYTRQGADEWLLTEADGLAGTIQLASLPVTLKLSDIYRQVEF